MQVEGLFEIHITTHHASKYYDLWKYTFAKKDFKLILAVSEQGVQKEQYMISKWKNGTFEDVLDKTKKIVEDMIKNNIKIGRVKIESMAHNKGIPESEEDYKLFMDNNEFVGMPYFEFHAKVDIVNNTLDNLLGWCNDMKTTYKVASNDNVCVGISANICGSKTPLLTIRIYNHGRGKALEYKNAILDNLKNLNYKIIGNIQQEFSVYDTYDYMDKEWLI